MDTTRARLTAAAALIIPLISLGAGSAHAADLRQRLTGEKPVRSTVDPDHHDAREVVVKFHEGTHVRLRGGRLTFDPAALTPEDRVRMGRHDLTEKDVRSDVARANAVLAEAEGTVVGLFARSHDLPAAERERYERAAGEELADLGLYSMLVLDEPDVAVAERTLDALNALRSIELSYPEPLPAAPAADIAPTTTIDLRSDQGYLRRADLDGIDADWAGRLPGGRGAGIMVVDVEAGWDKDHEDLPGAYFAENGWNFTTGSHGAGVLGVLAGADNGYGVTGIVPDVALGLSSPIWATAYSPHNAAAAVDNAATPLRRGDVLVIEQHYPIYNLVGATQTPPGSACSAGSGQCGYLPAEGVQAVYDSVRLATAKGIVVVAAAGNGSMNLDDPFWGGRFDRSVRDSGAIIVGAGGARNASSRLAHGFSNFGARVDLQGWGDSVATLGTGEDATLRANGNDARQWYTKGFGGTSSATPIVAGAAAAINGSRLADGEPLFDGISMRQWLRATGTPQPAGNTATAPIGPLPNLRAALPAIAGRLDGVDSAGIVRGFAFNSAALTKATGVQFHVDGPAGAGVPAGSTTTGTSSPLANTEFGITGNHGFEHAIPHQFRDDATHTLFAKGYDTTGGALRDRPLERTFPFKLPNVEGESLGVDANGRAKGWAFAHSAPAQSINVALFLDGPRDGGGTPLGTYAANASSPVALVPGNHGFDIQLPAHLKDGKAHVLHAYAIDPRGVRDQRMLAQQFFWCCKQLGITGIG